VVIYPKADRKEAALFHPGDTFEDKTAPFSLKVVKIQPNGTYKLEFKIK
jgi:hypothetical protein